MDDRELLETYARNRSEAAFGELVRRHLSWVYSVALRHVGDSSLAEEVAQSVFVLLARKAGGLRPGTILGGWLFRTTRFVGNRAVRAEKRRRSREQTAASMTPIVTSPGDNEALWVRVAPHLDQAVAALSETDRAAILLRFYEKKTLLEIGQRLGLSEEAAKKRVSRAVDKLRTLLGQRGVALGAVVLVGILVQNTVQAAPAALAASVVGASGAATLPALARETLSAWRSAQIKFVSGLATASVCLVFVTGIASGWFSRHAAPQMISARGSLPTQVAAEEAKVPDAPAASAVPATSQATVKTGAITGLVLDDQDRPMAGAMVWGGFCGRPFAKDTTDGSGRFALDKAEAPNVVTVTADGFAADQQGFEPTNAPQLVFRLSSIMPLYVRVVDEAGQPISGVSFYMSSWWGRPQTLAQFLARQTGADGRLQWLSAPKGEMGVEFGKPGYRYSRTNTMTADGTEHLIVLHPAAKVSGSVTDADTGAPIESFQLTFGYTQPWYSKPVWDLRTRACTNGFYQLHLEEDATSWLRIEALGYETMETEVPITNGTEGFFNIQLKRQTIDNPIRGIVLLPDGSPAHGVDVALCTAQAGVMLNGTALEPGHFGIPKSQVGRYQKKTDDQGRFLFEPTPEAHTVVAAGAAGLGQARCFDFSKPLEIRLKPWGRVTGTVRTQDGKWAARSVRWEPPGRLTSWMTLEYDTKGLTSIADSAGRFTLEHVPPGDGRVLVADDGGAAPILSPSVQVEPGESVEVQVGGNGRPVTGKLIAPQGVEVRSWTNQVTFAQLHVDWNSYNMPENLTGSAIERWRLEFEDTEAGRAWLRDQYSYEFEIRPDGSFAIPEVLPGKYRLFINVSQGYLGSGQYSSPIIPEAHRIASTAMVVTVPEGNTQSPLDLGEIALIAD
jgi:RNA polymerase sigma factor (sigma-70 family)